jgi:hypothetical protein
MVATLLLLNLSAGATMHTHHQVLTGKLICADAFVLQCCALSKQEHAMLLFAGELASFQMMLCISSGVDVHDCCLWPDQALGMHTLACELCLHE